jgi:uncharacterized membrane protein
MKDFFIIYILLFVLDLPYIQFLARPIYQKMINTIQKEPLNVKTIGVIISYMFMTLAFYKIVNNSYYNAFFLGLTIYGIYNFVNYSIFNDYLLYSAIIDTIWGSILYMITLYVYKIIKN